MADAAAGAAVELLLQVLTSLLSEEVKLVRGFKDDLEKLQNSLSMTQKYLSDAEKKDIKSEAVKEWLKQLEDVAFEADAVLDEFNYHLLQKKLKNQKRETKEVSSSCSFSCGSSTSLRFRRKMAHKIDDVNKKLETINEDASKYHLQEAVVSAHDASTVGPEETDEFSVELNVVGRGNDVAKIVEMVVNAPPEEKITVIPIVGMGGLGKTTLAQQVYRDQEIATRFEKKIWVCVSFDFEVLTLLQKILETLTGQDVQGIVTKQVVLQKIHKDLASKRYLLVLDDLWNDKPEKWEDFMKPLLGISNVTQNVIVVTTRQKNVASLVKTLPLYDLTSLSVDYCWFIIKAKALSTADDPQEYEKIGKSIAQKCGGLPLAANVIGGMLRGKPKEEWSSIMNQLSNFGRDDDNHVTKILKLSYNRLPSSSLKRCFAYCSIFPQDFKIPKETLIEQWLAEGFLQTNQGNDHLENIGNAFFNHLLHASLIQESERDDFGNVTHCRMHDLVHDLAHSVSGYRSKIVENDSGNDMNEVRYLYLTSSEPYHISKEQAKRLRTLIFNGKVADNMFSENSCLHVLKLDSSVEELPIEIVKQIHMRFLDISSTRIKNLPDSINKLSNLQTLVVPNVVEKLPNTIIELLNLRHLHIPRFTELPPFIGKLTSLQTLPYYEVGLDDGCRIGELENLKNLKGTLDIRNLQRVKDKGEAVYADLFGKSNISKLVLEWTESRENDIINDENVLEGLQPHPNLKSLTVRGYESRNWPSWTMKMTVYNAIEGRRAELNNLVEIKLYDCQCEKIPNLGHLPRLKFLELTSLSAVQSIGLSFYGLEDCSTSSSVIDNVNIPKTTTVFPALQKLLLFDMHNLMEWADVESSRVATTFPCLEYLGIKFCPQLESAPTHFPCLKELKIYEIGSNVSLTNICTNTSSLQRMEIGKYSGIIHLGDGMFVKNRDLSYLKIVDRPNIMTASSELPEHHLSTLLQSLRELHIFNCAELKSIPNFDLPSLRDLSIEACAKLESIPNRDLPSLESLSIHDCAELKSIPNFDLPSLRYLSITECAKLESIPNRDLPSLESLYIEDCAELKSIPNFDLPSLERLSIEDCAELKSIHNFDLPSLRHLSIKECAELESIPNRDLPSLESLSIEDCAELKSIPNFDLPSLERLSIEDCAELKSIHNFDLPSLRELSIKRCAKLESIPNSDLPSLRSLTIIYCPSLTCLQRELLESCTPSLENLELSQLPNVENMDDVMSCIWRMSRLERLCLDELPKLTNLPTEICCLRSLRSLQIGGFPAESVDVVSFNDYLNRILHESHCLQQLQIHGNEDWGSLSDRIQHLDALNTLHIIDYGNIEALPKWIGNLSSLRNLVIGNCKRLRQLPSKEAMQRLTKLERLVIHDCPLLKVERCSPTHQHCLRWRGAADDSEWPKISHIESVTIDFQQLPTRNSIVQDEKKFAGCFPIPRNRRR